MTAMAEDVSDLDLILQARATVTTHWLTEGYPGPGVRACPDCIDTGCERCRLAAEFLRQSGVPGLWIVDDSEPLTADRTVR
jgi:hypothetical protein